MLCYCLISQARGRSQIRREQARSGKSPVTSPSSPRNLPSERVGGGSWLPACVCGRQRASQGAATCLNDPPRAENEWLQIAQHPLPRACKPASPTPDDKGNRAPALRRENGRGCFMLNSNPTPRSRCFFSGLPFAPHRDLPLRPPAHQLLSSLQGAEPASSGSAGKEGFS